MSKRISLLVVILSILLVGAIHAQTEPATTSFTLPEGPIKVTVTGVQGIVQYRTGADQKWTKAAEGVELTEGAELRTGPRSAVRFMIGDDQVVTLDRLGTIQILKANFENGKVFTDLGMKYGRTRYDIESAAREHDAKVRSPSSVLAVRGTQFALDDEAPFPPTAVSLSGRVMFQDAHKLVAFGAKGKGKAKITTETDSSANNALNNSFANPSGIFTGQTPTQQERLLEASYGSKLQTLGVASLIDQARLQNFPAAVVFVQEELQIEAFWTGAFGSAVDLSVRSPKGEILDAAHPTVPSGGTLQLGTAGESGAGLSTARWTEQFPPGQYDITTTLKTPGSVNVILSVERDPHGFNNDFAQLVGPPGGQGLPYPLDSKNPSKTVSVNVTTGKGSTPAAASAVAIKRGR